MRLTIWMNMPSPYQADFFTELAQAEGIDLEVVYAYPLEEGRKSLGWTVADGSYGVTFLSTGARGIRQAAKRAWEDRDRVHIINGVWAVPAFLMASTILLSTSAAIFFHGEAADPRVGRSVARECLRAVIGRIMLARAKGVFAIARLGERFYARHGAAADQILPFGYFKRHEFRRTDEVRTEREILFVGQLVERKAVDVLIAAFATMSEEFPHARLVLVGAGDAMDDLQRRAREAGISDRVRFEGAINSGLIDERIRRASILVLPSRWDGWGLVVNEALAVGVPVIVSDRCGASDLVRSVKDGFVIPADDAAALRRALCIVLRRDRSLVPDELAWQEKIGLRAIVSYFLACLVARLSGGSSNPAVPWSGTLNDLAESRTTAGNDAVMSNPRLALSGAPMLT